MSIRGLSVLVLLAACRHPAAPFELDQRHVRADADAAIDWSAALERALADGAPGPIVLAAAQAPAEAVAPHADAIARAVDEASPDELAAAAAVADATRAPGDLIAKRLALIAAHTGVQAGADVQRDVIAVLLPLTGTFGAVGRGSRVAIELAPADGARRVIIDTAGDPARAAIAVDEAVAAGAVAILGPVGVREADAAARRAAQLGVPIALLAPADGADPRAGVFRLVDSPESEARAAAQFAADLGVPTVAVMAPRDDVGIAAGDAFAAAATAAGLEVTARGLYNPTATDLEPDVKELLGLDPATNARLAAHLRRKGKRGWQSFSPDVPFALLYIPDRYDRAALVASYLPYLGVEVHSEDFADLEVLQRKHGGRLPQVVQLLGSSGWHHPSLAIRGGPAVEGSYFIEPCLGVLGDGAAPEIAAAFRDRTGRDASPAAGQAHDAWTLVARARTRAAGARDPRAAFTAALLGATVEDGACAPGTVGPDGQLTRAPAVLGVVGGEITVVPY